LTRAVCAPRARAIGSAVAGELRNEVSWRIETCVVDADAGPGAVTARAVSESAAVSRPQSFVGFVNGVCIGVLSPWSDFRCAINRSP
jgi:hypothetical protein